MHTATALQVTRSLEELDAEIGELSAHIDAATCRLLLCIAEFDRREGWGASGFRSCAEWLGWRVGLDLGAARERLRVGRALEKLPRIRAALASGEVSYSKVRAMSRVAAPETEEELLEVARHGTAAHLERLTRLFRRCTNAEEREQAKRQHEQRYLTTWTDEEGMLCLRGRLPAEVGAMVKGALRAAMRALAEREGDETEPAVEPAPPPMATPRVSAETSPRPASPAGLDDDAVAERELHESERGTFVGWAPSKKLHPRVEIAPGEREQRTADALGLVAEWTLDAIHQGGGRAVGRRRRPAASGREGRFEVVLHVDAEVLAGDAPVGRCECEAGPRLSAETMRRLCCSSPVVTLAHGKEGELLGPGHRTRRISAPLWRALSSRDTTCAWPGCTARHDLVVHHVEHWAHGGETKLPNLIRICRSHHWALHEGGFHVEGRAPDGLTFFALDGRALPTIPAAVEGDADEVVRRNAERGIEIGPATGMTRWQGEELDYDWAVASLAQRTRKR
jgi:hypothetical protein